MPLIHLAPEVVRSPSIALSMKTISQNLARQVLAELPKSFEGWWQPVPGTAPDVQLALHRLRMSFVHAVLKMHGHTGRGAPFPSSLAVSQPLSVRQASESRAQCQLRELPPTPIETLVEPAACAAVRAEIFPFLPSDLSRYLYLALLQGIDTPRFNYPSLQNRFSAYKLHTAIVALATAQAWKLCLIHEQSLRQAIRGCLQEMSGGSLEHLLQLCSRPMAEGAPFAEIDRVLRRCLIPILTAMAGSVPENGIS